MPLPSFNLFAGTNIGAPAPKPTPTPAPTVHPGGGLVGNFLSGVGNFFGNAYNRGQSELGSGAPNMFTSPRMGARANYPGVVTPSSANANAIKKTYTAPAVSYTGPKEPVNPAPAYPLAGSSAGSTAGASAMPPPSTLTADQIAKANAGNYASGRTPSQMAAGGAPTLLPGTNLPASNYATPQGALGALLFQTQGYEQQQAALNQQAQDAISKYANAEAGLRGGWTGIGANATAASAQMLEQTKQNALSQIEQQQAALAGYQSPIMTGLTAGLNAATGFQNAPYGQPLYNPLTGEYTMAGGAVGGTGGTTGTAGGMTPQGQSQQLAQEVISGKRTYQDAVNSMGAYGSMGTTFLNNAISQIDPTFNYAQATSLGTTQGQVNPALNQAQMAINNLQSVMQNIPGWQASNIPVVNSLTSLLSEIGIGTGTQTQKNQAIGEARTNVANALGAITNTTPSAWDSLMNTWFPNNATPEQVASGVQQFNTLASYRATIYGQPGSDQPFTPEQAQTYLNSQNATGTSTASGSGLYNW